MIRRIPMEPWAYLQRAIAYGHRAEPDKALADYDRAITINPNIPHFHSHRDRLLADRKDFDQALAAADEAVRLRPNEPMFLMNRAEIRVLSGDGARGLAY